MADFNGTILTDKGRNLLSKALTGTALQFTKVSIGDGIWDDSVTPEKLDDLVSKKIDLPINELDVTGDGTARLRFVLTNTGLEEGFFTREIGIYANDPDLGEILYAVTYANDPDYIPNDRVVKVENVTDIYTVVSNTQNVEAVINDTVVIATKDDVKNLAGVDDSLILEKLKNVDGAGSGLDADTIDGKQASDLANVDLSNINNLGKILDLDGEGSGLDTDLIRGLPGDFTNNLNSAGYQKLPSGLIIQWGNVSWKNGSSSKGSSIETTITFPITFPNICFCLLASNSFPDDGLESTEHTLATSVVSNSQGKLREERVYGSNSGNEHGHSFWIAIGY